MTNNNMRVRHTQYDGIQWLDFREMAHKTEGSGDHSLGKALATQV